MCVFASVFFFDLFNISLSLSFQSYWTWIINGAVTCRDVRVGRSLIAPVCRVKPSPWIDTPFLNEYFVCVDILRNDDVSGPFDYLGLCCSSSGLCDEEVSFCFHLRIFFRSSKKRMCPFLLEISSCVSKCSSLCFSVFCSLCSSDCLHSNLSELEWICIYGTSFSVCEGNIQWIIRYDISIFVRSVGI